MQEQPHYNITPEQGWSKMRPALDDAMPVDRPSRRFGFLWWSTSAVLMSGVIGLFVFKGAAFFMQHPSSTLPAIEATQERSTGTMHTGGQFNPIEPKVNANSSIPASSEPEQKINLSKGKSTKTSKSSIKAISPLNNSAKPKQTEPIASAIILKATEPGSNTASVETSNQTSAIESIANAEKTEALDAGANSSIATTVVNESLLIQEALPSGATQSGVASFKIVEMLPGLNASSVRSEERVSDVVYAGSVRRSRTSTPFIEPNISVSGLIGVNGGIGGTASAGADLNISRRFSVSAGVGYLAYTPQASFFGSSKDLATNTEFNAILNYDPTYEGINTYVDGSSVNSAAGYNVINPLVEKLRQWQISAGLKWKMSGRFYMDGGVTIGLGTTAYSEYPIVSGDPLSQTPYVKIGNSLNSYDVIRSTMTSIYGGIGYNATKHFDVFANWTHGFDSYILSEPGIPSADLSDDSRTDYIRGLNLGLRYTL